MRQLIQPVIRFIFMLCLINPAFAQNQTAVNLQRPTPTITAFASGERLRFTAPSSVVLMRLEVYAANGAKLFDNELRGGNVIDWYLVDGQATPFADGAYLCVITVKDLSGKITQRIGSVKIDQRTAKMLATELSQLTAQQTSAIGPLEEDALLTFLEADHNQTATVVAHDGTDGQLIRGRGALSFRIGDFYGGKDQEQMRLNEEGNLGIGIAQPQARLDVDGFVRASQGIVFPDGSIQFSASRKTFGPPSQRPAQFQQKLTPRQEHLAPDISGTGTTGKIAKWIDGPAGLLGDSLLTEASGSIGVNGSPDSRFKLDVNGTTRIRGSNPAFNLEGLRAAGNQWVFQTVDDDGRFRIFGQDNVNPGQERLTIKLDSGRVGIGNGTPTFKLHVVDTGNSGLRVQTNAVGGTLASFGGFGDFVIDAVNVPGGRLIVKENGRVGIGTADPAQKFQVETDSLVAVVGLSSTNTGVVGTSTSGTGVGGISFSGFGVRGLSNSGVGVVGESLNGQLFKGANGSAIKFLVDNDGTVHAPAYEGLSDFAEEILPSPAERVRLEPGDVLVAAKDSDRSVTRSRKPYSTAVLGIYSTAPGFIGRETPLESNSSETIPMAVIGIVPCKVSAENGPIRRGDLLTTSRTPGHAMRCASRQRCSGAIVGKALAALERGTGVIKVLVSLQ